MSRATSDWNNALKLGYGGATSDWNNALKLGYDVRLLSYPPWLLSLLEAHNLKEGVLPRVVRPGAEV
ncbi:hypothetical protein T484DRAFT_1870261 [Baffinella frigidus]|nr:hypothetical protein T484DRAFT_1870261 [Cryptophyta sp. CCMP2293]